MNYVVLFNDDGPKYRLDPTDKLRIGGVGNTLVVNNEFGPMDEQTGVPIQQLERIRSYVASNGDEREIQGGDAIVLDGKHVYIYGPPPTVGGFYSPPSDVARCVLKCVA